MMYVNRYSSDLLVEDGKLLGSNLAIANIRQAVSNGNVNFRVIVLKEGVRLDHLAGRFYGDGRLWWIIAAASDIGWWLQVPPGTSIRIPTDLNQIAGLV